MNEIDDAEGTAPPSSDVADPEPRRVTGTATSSRQTRMGEDALAEFAVLRAGMPDDASPDGRPYDDPQNGRPPVQRAPRDRGSDRDSGPTRGGRPGWLTGALVVVGIVVVGLGLYVGAAFALAGQVPFNTTIGGVAVGGSTRDTAIARLEDEFADRAVAPLAVEAGIATAELDPVAAGLTLDATGSIDEVTGFSLAPARMWQHIVGAGRRPIGAQIDGPALDAAVAELAATVDTPPVEGGVIFVGGIAQGVTPATGTGVDVPAATALLREQWLTGELPIDLPMTETEPTADAADVEAALAAAQQVVAGPVVVSAGARQVSVPAGLFGDTLSYGPDGSGGLALSADGARLREIVLSLDPAVESPPVDARVAIENGAPVVVPGVNGVVIDPAALATAVTSALTAAGGDRVATVEAVGREPEFTTADAEALGITEVVSTFSTQYPDNAARTENLRIAAATINGVIVAPGETFSLNDVLGERTVAKGYRAAGAILNGRFTTDVGGGVSQVSTTLYNATFFAGLEDVTHKAHSFYISRYPEGREATLNWDPRVENQFRNDGDHAILIEASVGGGQITVTYWGTKVYDVESVTSDRFNFRSPETIYDPSAECEAADSSQGFDVTVTRIWKVDGAEVRRESQTTVYAAAPKVICGPRP